MNPSWHGDSFDLVKRYFVDILHQTGYTVFADPMFTGAWNGNQATFFQLIGAHPIPEDGKPTKLPSALFLDPDTGIGSRPSKKHVMLNDIVARLAEHSIVFAYDQSFSRNVVPLEKMREKMAGLHKHGIYSFYYNSHARFLFAFKAQDDLQAVRQAILASGMPSDRLLVYVGA